MNTTAIIAALEAAAGKLSTPLAANIGSVLVQLVTNLPQLEIAGEAILAGGEAALGPAEAAIKAFIGLGTNGPTDADWTEALDAVDANSATIQSAAD